MSVDLSAYSDASVFGREIGSLFSERLYVGTTGEYPDLDSYRSFTLGAKVVTVRRTADNIKAFGNVCLHRSNIIDPLGTGKRHFICGFHGWSYDAGGELVFTPFTDKSCIKKRSLPVYPVSETADLLFVGLSGTSPCVEKIGPALEKTGITISEAFHKSTLLHNCNWKLLVENILESYHLNFVHRSTFLRSGFTSTSTHQWESDAYINLASIIPQPATSKTNAIRKLAKNATHSYRHAYIFPDLFISNTNDLIGFVSHIHPIDQTTTMLAWQLFELPEMKVLPPAIRDHIRNEAIDFSLTTLAEDKCMVESCQIGISSELRSLQLQPVEDRVQAFHDYYNKCMSHAR